MKKVLIFFVITVICVLLLIIGWAVWLMRPFPIDKSSISPLNPKMIIAHAGGTIDRHTYTNCKEALLKSISEGYQYIELDLYGTTDNQIVCLHKLEDFHEMTGLDIYKFDTRTFKSVKFYNKYTPLTLKEAIEIWEATSFIFVTDKISDPNILNNYFIHNRSRVMVETAYANNFKTLNKDGYITMLSLDKDINGLIKFIVSSIRNGTIIDRIVIPKATDIQYLRLYKRLGVKMAMYTINDKDSFNRSLAGYINYIYTDSISPKDTFNK